MNTITGAFTDFISRATMETKMKHKNTNGSLLGAITMVIMIAMGVSGCNRAGADAGKEADYIRPVKAVELKPAPLETVMTFPGEAKAEKEVNLAFRVGGPLTELNVDDGMKVSKGDIIARIDSRDFRVNVKTLAAKLAASEAQYAESTLQYERYKKLVKVYAASKSTYDQVKAGYEMSAAQVEADTRNLEAARNALTDTALVAPFNGYVHRVLVENHETVKQGQPVVWLVDLSGMEVEIGIPESLLTGTGNFTSYRCLFDAIPGVVYQAELKEIGKKPNASNSTYPLTLTLKTGEDNRVRPGMSADVNISVTLAKGTETFVVPATSLVNKQSDTSYVWIFNRNTGKVEKRLVTPLRLLTGGVEVQGNIREGEWLVTAGAHHLKDGQTTRVLDPVSETNIGQVL